MLRELASYAAGLFVNLDQVSYPLQFDLQKNPSPTAQKWISEADRKLELASGLRAGQTYPLTPLERNQRINYLYASMYANDPRRRFGWAGLAAFGSATVGGGLRDATTLGGLSLLHRAKADFCRMAKLLAIANKAIYSDIYWQHLAYLHRGIDELAKIYREGGLTDRMRQNWQILHLGDLTNNQKLINEAARLFLKYEQELIVQPLIYAGQNALWDKAIFLNNIGFLIPGQHSKFRDYMLKKRKESGFSFAVFEDRWQWLEEAILPAWERVTVSNPDLVETKLMKICPEVSASLTLEKTHAFSYSHKQREHSFPGAKPGLKRQLSHRFLLLFNLF